MTHTLSLDALRVEDSCYRLPAPFEDEREARLARQLLTRSLGQIGMQLPLLVHELEPGAYHLMDGFRRVSVVRELGWLKVPCCILPKEF